MVRRVSLIVLGLWLLVASVASAADVLLKWDHPAPEKLSGFIVEQRMPPAIAFAEVGRIPNTLPLQYALTMEPNTFYCWRVIAFMTLDTQTKLADPSEVLCDATVQGASHIMMMLPTP